MANLFYDISQVLGITILHSLWNGLLVFLALKSIFTLRPSLSSIKRYNLSMLALFCIVLAFTYTFYAEAESYNWHPFLSTNSVPVIKASNFSPGSVWPVTYHNPILNLPVKTTTFGYYKTSLYNALKNYLPYISFLYAIGLLFNLCRLGIALNKIRVIKQSLVAATQIQPLISQFSKQLRLRWHIQASFSQLIDVPCVIGYFKPILLLPVTLTTQLSAAEIEAILLHELTHIKNSDYLLNLLQQIITVLLFFNPSAQLISRLISIERENRCDDMVIEITGSPLIYAHALLKLEETRQVNLRFALAATGKKYHLLSRIERMMKAKKPVGNIRHLVLAVVLFTGCLIFCFSFKTASLANFTLSGKITGEANASVYLSYIDDHQLSVIQTCPLRNGNFTLKGSINGSRKVFFSLYKGSVYKLKGEDDPNKTSFFLEPGNVTVTGAYNNLKALKINGSKSQTEYELFQVQYNAFNKESDSIENEFLKVNEESIIAMKQHKSDKIQHSLNNKLNNIRQQLEPYRLKYQQIGYNYIASHSNSYVSALELLVDMPSMPLNTVKNLFNGFSPAIQSSSYGKEIKDGILTRENNSAGKKAKDFTTVDINGKPLQLSAFKGRYVLLDFWISTEPRLDNAPHLMQLFTKYNKSGFDIIAVADDDHDPQAWRDAIQKNGTQMWNHVLRGLKKSKNGFDLSNSIDDKFDVNSCPTRILIDKNGIIIGRYIGTEETDALNKKLAQIFD